MTFMRFATLGQFDSSVLNSHQSCSEDATSLTSAMEISCCRGHLAVERRVRNVKYGLLVWQARKRDALRGVKIVGRSVHM